MLLRCPTAERFLFRFSESQFGPEVGPRHAGIPAQQTGTQPVQKEKHQGFCFLFFCLAP